MLVREVKRLVVFIGPLLALIYIGVRLCFGRPSKPDVLHAWTGYTTAHGTKDELSLTSFPKDGGHSLTIEIVPPRHSVLPQPDGSHVRGQYNVVFSVSTKNRKFFNVHFGTQRAINPNIIPHPTHNDTWIIVAQQFREHDDQSVWFAELVCNAVFHDEALECTEPPSILPIAATLGDKCAGDLAHFSFNIGPHDARVFYGPKVPYATYGSNSKYTCFGQWIQDLRVLVPWGLDMLKQDQFRQGTELQRPPPYSPVEKNYFIFWDTDEQPYAHYEVASKRVFAQLQDDGSVGPDIAPLAEASDEKCIEKYMPRLAPQLESIHQATNSLAITMCRRNDPGCKRNESNTFLFTIFQHKTYYEFHSVYDPYIMVFQQRKPFAIHGFSRQPIWIHGREMLPHLSDKQSQMFYVVSMSWKSRGQKYHGYLDDILFLAFGIEDQMTAGIDVVAGDLLKGLGLCSET